MLHQTPLPDPKPPSLNLPPPTPSLSSNSSFHSIFPVCVYPASPEITSCSAKIVSLYSQLVPEFGVRSHSEGPYGTIYAFTYSSGVKERVMFATEMIEALWIYDDITEELPFEDAMRDHHSISDLLSSSPTFPGSVTRPWMTRVFHDYAARITALDPSHGATLIEKVKEYITGYDGSDAEFETMEEYIDFRWLNVRFGAMEAFMQWTNAIHLSPSEISRCENFYKSAGTVMALTNDFFSWEKEKGEVMDRVRNAVPIVMWQYEMSEAQAKTHVKKLAVEAERETRRLGRELV